GKILRGQPVSATEIRATVPPHVDAAIRRALEKLPADRFATAGEFGKALADTGFRHGIAAAGAAGEGAGPWKMLTYAAGVAAIGAFALAGWALTRPEPRDTVLRYYLDIPLESGSNNDFGTNIDLSPDGEKLVYIGDPEGPARLWVRERHDLDPRPISGGEGAFQPFFSPDGEKVAFITAGRALRVVSLAGEPPVTLADSGIVRGGGSWGPDGYLYLAGGDGGAGTPDRIVRMPATGGPMEPVTTLDEERGEIGHVFPVALPGGRGILFSAIRERLYAPGLIDIAVADLSTGEHKILLEGLQADWSVTGHILAVRADGALVAAPFDEETLELTGPATPLLGGVEIEGLASADLTISENGTLVYAPGDVTTNVGSDRVMLIQRNGAAEEVEPGWRGIFLTPRFSPDGKRLALAISQGGDTQIWIKQLEQGPLAKLTFEGSGNLRPAWYPDGEYVAFRSNRGANPDLYRRRADGAVQAELLLDEEAQINEVTISPDGAWVVYRSGADIYGRRLGEEGEAVPLVVTSHNEGQPTISPDGRWMAYISSESGEQEVYVRPFPETDTGKWLISNGGGIDPLWSPDGSELFYRAADGNLMAVEVIPGPTFIAGPQQVLFDASGYLATAGERNYDISPDGQRFVMIELGSGAEIGLVVVENFFREIEARLGR
ncbi:MAG TPA: hypothetical protein VLA36_04975, partial [Longimicrobiales bacterium]|nr:hypothetical protein [Longimicrobiales bacterium]